MIPMPDGMASDLPEELDFHFPRSLTKEFVRLGERGVERSVVPNDEPPMPPVKLAEDDLDELYRQLVCWCLIQRFWYYVLAENKCTDLEYDFIERHVAKLEKMRPESPLNRYSPTTRVASTLWWNYPPSVIKFFHPVEKFQELCKEGERRVREKWKRAAKY